MRIIVAGGSGFLGRALVTACRGEGHEVKVLTRHPRHSDDVRWSPGGDAGPWIASLERSDAVVNLAGEGIADSAWTTERKRAILESRLAATRTLAAAIGGCEHPPRVFLSASGVGFYGTSTAGPVTEESPPGADFLADVCQAWEFETRAAAGTARIVLLRTGLVLARGGGALPRMSMPFRFFVGGRIGSGRQYVSWIHLADWVGMVQWALSSAAVAGPLNVTAPSPVTNAEFTRTLAAAMRRPALFPVPALALRIILGREMADTMLLEGQQALPAKAQQLGYRFAFPTVGPALRDLFTSS
jgi:uncharacterized protein (TIGR01777 family)